MNTPTVGRGFLVRADPVNAHDMASAPTERTNMEKDRTMTRKSKEITNTSKIIRVDQASHQEGTLRDHARMYVPTLVKAELGSGRRTRVTTALPDSGNLLARTVINAEFHKKLGIPIYNTKIWARATNQQTLEVQGVSKGIYLKFPNISKIFFVKPLVVHNLSCNLNLGAQFNFKTGLILQKVMQGEDRRKTNFSELDGIRIQLQFKNVSHVMLCETLTDPEFLQCLKGNPLC